MTTETPPLITKLSYPVYSHVQAEVRANPVGEPGFNQIVAIVRREPDGTKTTIRGALYPVRKGPLISFGTGPRPDQRPGFRAGADIIPARDYWASVFMAPMYYVEADGHRILEVPEHETWPKWPPAPRVPLRRRARAHARKVVDAIAGRLGYHRDGECEHDW
jgi:hypothetical protein